MGLHFLVLEKSNAESVGSSFNDKLKGHLQGPHAML